MAEHPTSNTNEAAIARAEMERLRLEHPSVSRQAYIDGFPYDTDIAEAIREVRTREEAGVRVPGDAGYYAWARTLSVGDTVVLGRTGYIGDWSTGTKVSVMRMTKSQYIMSNGEKYRRTGKLPGYKVGETYNQGYRKFFMCVPRGK